MINFNKERQVAVVYPCGICNLNCRYCTIDKNPVLSLIDKELEDSFKDDYYFERIKAYFPRRDQLKALETWGGEPFLHMERVHSLLFKLIDYYPYFYRIHSSTNFSFDNWVDKFMDLMNCFGNFPDREFLYDLQLSVDGPEYINDANRGLGVTKKCINNIDKLIQIIKEDKFPKNVTLSVAIKGTWDVDTLYKLNSKEKIIEFFQFYEDNYIDKFKQLNNDKIIVHYTVPNMAMPSPITKKDGEVFANIAALCREIEQENNIYHYFKYYINITPFSVPDCMNCHQFTGDVACCGSGQQMVGFLPHNMVSACHEGFTLLLDNYKIFAAKRQEQNLSVSLNKFFELSPTPMCLTDDEFIEHERKMSYLQSDSTAQMANATTIIIALAMAGLIEPQYLNENNAMIAAKGILLNTCFCIKVNYAENGSFCTEHIGYYILLLNGALKYLMENYYEHICPT